MSWGPVSWPSVDWDTVATVVVSTFIAALILAAFAITTFRLIFYEAMSNPQVQAMVRLASKFAGKGKGIMERVGGALVKGLEEAIK